jgi:hypothetical protein
MSTISENPNNGTNLSKSKKKRMKRKQAKQNAGDDISSVSSVPSLSDNVRESAIPGTGTSSGTKLNPFDSLRMDLANRGYRLAEIEDAMSEMWDKNLPYDSFDDVLEFLENKRRGIIANNNNNNSTIIQGDTGKMETTTTANGPNMCADHKDATGGIGYVGHDTMADSATAPTTASFDSYSPTTLQKDHPEGVFVEDELQHPAASTSSPLMERNRTLTNPKHSKRAASNLDIITKLQAVATYENLHDAIFAITQWANLAKPNEVRL